MIAAFVTIGAVGIVLAILGVLMDTYSDINLGVFMAGVVMFFVGFLGSTITLAGEQDKEHCLKDLPQISQRETKWLNSECYVKAKDGKFVPLEWIEEGYEK